MKKGFTTGIAAVAAAKAAAILLFEGRESASVTVHTPLGVEITLGLESLKRQGEAALAMVRKDAGDDPDVTHGLLIGARVERRSEPGVGLAGGEGVGRVTRPGLKLAVGAPAINPVPRQGILAAVAEVLPPGEGVLVTIFIPGGEAVARRTMNARLGIEGGLSILGTTGIVEPMSEEAWKHSLSPQLSLARAAGFSYVVLTPGRSGERQAIAHGFSERSVAQVSNFFGFMLDEARKVGFAEVILWGHLGKLVKLAAGIFHTHSAVADGRREVIALEAALRGAPPERLRELLATATAEEQLGLIGRDRDFWDGLARKASERARERIYGEMRIGTVLLDLAGEVIGCDQTAQERLANLGSTLSASDPVAPTT